MVTGSLKHQQKSTCLLIIYFTPGWHQDREDWHLLHDVILPYKDAYGPQLCNRRFDHVERPVHKPGSGGPQELQLTLSAKDEVTWVVHCDITNEKIFGIKSLEPFRVHLKIIVNNDNGTTIRISMNIMDGDIMTALINRCNRDSNLAHPNTHTKKHIL